MAYKVSAPPIVHSWWAHFLKTVSTSHQANCCRMAHNRLCKAMALRLRSRCQVLDGFLLMFFSHECPDNRPFNFRWFYVISYVTSLPLPLFRYIHLTYVSILVRPGFLPRVFLLRGPAFPKGLTCSGVRASYKTEATSVPIFCG